MAKLTKIEDNATYHQKKKPTKLLPFYMDNYRASYFFYQDA